VYYEGWKPESTPVKPRSRDIFLTRVGVEMSPEIVWGMDEAVSTVFSFLSHHVSAGEMRMYAQACLPTCGVFGHDQAGTAGGDQHLAE
jgi:uncharacterized protein (DUF2267 family)